MWWKKRRSPGVKDEVRFHRDRLIEDYIASGMDRKEAERRAFLEFGNVPQIEEACQDVRGRWLDDLVRDLRYAMRSLGRTRGFTAVAVLSLALGIGANTAIFSLVNAVMLRTLPVLDPDRIVQVSRMTPDGQPGQVSYPIFEHFRDNLRSVSGMFAQMPSTQSIVIDGDEDFVTADLVTGAYFGVLGLDAAAGRLLAPSDEMTTASPIAVVISHRYWQRRFGRSPSAIGSAFSIRDRVFTIVGVTPAAYHGAQSGRVTDLMIPLWSMTTAEQRRSIGSNALRVLARLKPGVAVAQANAEAEALFASFMQVRSVELLDPRQRAAVVRQRAGVVSAPDGINPIRDNLARPLLILMGIVGLILILACVNLSGLLLARTAARQREISIRLAIGAGRGRLMRQFLTESLVIALIGGGGGFVLANWFSRRCSCRGS